MKIILPFLFTLFLMNCASFAQEQESESTANRMQIGLTGLPIIYVNNGQVNPNGLALYSNVGWFIKEKHVLGLRPFLGMVRTNFENAIALGGNVYYRYYFNNSDWRIFADANLGFGHIWHQQTAEVFFTQVFDGTLFNFAYGFGVDWEIKNGWSLEILVQYLEMKNLTHPKTTFIGRAIIPSIGLQRFF